MDPGDFQNAFPPTSEEYAMLYDSMQEQAAQWPQVTQPTASPTTSFPFPMQHQPLSDASSLSAIPLPFQGSSYPFSPPQTISPDGHAPPAAAATYIQYRPLAPSEPPPDTSEVVSVRKERRREQNRVSQRQFRERKEEKIREMRMEIEKLKTTITGLSSMNDEQQAEIARLKDALENLESINSPISVSDAGSVSGTGDLLSTGMSGSQRGSVDLGSGGMGVSGPMLMQRPMMERHRYRKEAVVRLLIENGAEVTMMDKDGQTALHEAAKNGCDIAVRLLLEKKVDISAKDKDGQTALHKAARSGHEEVVRLLLEHKPDVDVTDKAGETALHLAASNRHEATVQLLLSASDSNFPS